MHHLGFSYLIFFLKEIYCAYYPKCTNILDYIGMLYFTTYLDLLPSAPDEEPTW